MSERQPATTNPAWKIGIMSPLLDTGLEQAPAVARDWGFDGVELVLNTDAQVQAWSDRAFRTRVARRAASTGCAIPSCCPTCLNLGNLGNDEPYLHRPAARLIETLIDTLPDVGGRIILLPFFAKADLKGPATIDRVVERIQPLADRAEQKGVVLALETTLSALSLQLLLERLPSPAVKVYYDLANAVWQGYDPADEIRRLGHAVVQVHLKDNVMDPDGWGGFRVVPLGRGRVDFAAAGAALRAVGFSGWLIMETAVTNGDYHQSAVDQLRFVRDHFS
jgi:L-ribulose-5-phosphate 3-epimerase